jgi:hypothetical protein
VGDYLHNLWKAWPERESQWHFAVQQGDVATRATWRGVLIHPYKPTASSLSTAIAPVPADTLILHYVGHAFQRKGVPVWLPAVIHQWRATHRGRVITMFHELYANSSPFNSAFWLKPVARSIIRALLAASDGWIATCERNWHVLLDEFHADPRKGASIPIGSNIPPTGIRGDGLRTSNLTVAVFGLPPTRMLALERHQRLLREMNANDQLGEVVMIGKRAEDMQRRRLEEIKQMVGGQWREAADLSTEQISAEFCRCDIGLVPTDVGILTKSTVFSGFVMNGVIPVVSNRDPYGLKTPLKECVLLNRDTQENVQEICDKLRQPTASRDLRQALNRAVDVHLNWPSIARDFAAVCENSFAPILGSTIEGSCGHAHKASI